MTHSMDTLYRDYGNPGTSTVMAYGTVPYVRTYVLVRCAVLRLVSEKPLLDSCIFCVYRREYKAVYVRYQSIQYVRTHTASDGSAFSHICRSTYIIYRTRDLSAEIAFGSDQTNNSNNEHTRTSRYRNHRISYFGRCPVSSELGSDGNRNVEQR